LVLGSLALVFCGMGAVVFVILNSGVQEGSGGVGGFVVGVSFVVLCFVGWSASDTTKTWKTRVLPILCVVTLTLYALWMTAGKLNLR
jgi:hypothetical protein